MKKQIAFTFILLTIFSVYAQSRRTLEVTRPRMNGEDVKMVQTKLVELGFTEVGEIDGYYGPKSEAAVMELKGLTGIPAQGYFDIVYDFLETPDSDLLYKAIKTYNQNKNEKNCVSKEEYSEIGNSAFDPTIYVYKTGNKTAYCLYEEVYDFYSLSTFIFKVNDSAYFVTEKESSAYNENGDGFNPWDENAKYEYKTTITSYLMSENRLFKIEKGKMEKAENDDLAKLIAYCKAKF